MLLAGRDRGDLRLDPGALQRSHECGPVEVHDGGVGDDCDLRAADQLGQPLGRLGQRGRDMDRVRVLARGAALDRMGLARQPDRVDRPDQMAA